MWLKSLGRNTDLIFSRFSGTVIEREDYLVIKTPSNKGFYWGNYLIFKNKPGIGDFQKWKNIFDQEFEYYETPHHYLFTWDSSPCAKEEVNEFLSNGFELDEGVVLTTTKLNSPKYYNRDIEIKKVESDSEWQSVIENQINNADPMFAGKDYEIFKQKQFADYRRMSELGMGNRFCAKIENKVVGDLGIFFYNNVARYQNVVTDSSFRRLGICGTLVYEAGLIALQEYDVEYLVMEADPDYHAAKIYESVGFTPTEKNQALAWWPSIHD